MPTKPGGLQRTSTLFKVVFLKFTFLAYTSFGWFQDMKLPLFFVFLGRMCPNSYDMYLSHNCIHLITRVGCTVHAQLNIRVVLSKVHCWLYFPARGRGVEQGMCGQGKCGTREVWTGVVWNRGSVEQGKCGTSCKSVKLWERLPTLIASPASAPRTSMWKSWRRKDGAAV